MRHCCPNQQGALLVIRGLRHFSQEQRPSLRHIWTIPNLLSTSRIALAPFLGYAVLTHHNICALGLLTYCSLSDLADGWIARRWRQESALGSLLDPLGDKLLVGMLAGTLAWTGQLAPGLALLMMGRDLGLIVAGLYVRYRMLPAPRTFHRFFDVGLATASVEPTRISKINTALQVLLLGGILLTPIIGMRSGEEGGTKEEGKEREQRSETKGEWLIRVLQYVVAATTIWSGISYIKPHRQIIRPWPKT